MNADRWVFSSFVRHCWVPNPSSCPVPGQGNISIVVLHCCDKMIFKNICEHRFSLSPGLFKLDHFNPRTPVLWHWQAIHLNMSRDWWMLGMQHPELVLLKLQYDSLTLLPMLWKYDNCNESSINTTTGLGCVVHLVASPHCCVTQLHLSRWGESVPAVPW